jgi:hypothetical protein
MKKLATILGICLLSGCASLHSPYDLYSWCMDLGSTRMASVGGTAQDPATCQRELKEDLDDPTPRILYIPRDVIMSPIIAARIAWGLVGLAQAPF